MKREDIIKLTREAGLGTALTHDGGENRVWIEGADWHDELVRFATLVAEHEREACAKVCEDESVLDYDSVQTSVNCAAAIRARSST